MNVKKYVKKPVVITAIKWTGDNLKEVISFTGLHESALHWAWEEYEEVVRKEGLKIFTLEGSHLASEEFRVVSKEQFFCPCCGLTVEVSK